jgi:2'-hydroxyisoflavone reductase
MDLLVVGGGVFLGASLVDAALARGHRVTVFTRGRARSVWPADVEVAVKTARATSLASPAGASTP